jgi:hypothetical protein
MKKYIILFAALAGAMLWTGCQKMEEDIVKDEPVEEAPQLFTLTVQAVKDVDTKALELDGSTLNAYWVDGEQVAVYISNTRAFLGMLTVDADDTNRTEATLSGTLSSVEGVAEGTQLYLLFPRAEWDYTGQDGTAPSAGGSLARQYDYASSTVYVSSMDNGVISTEKAFFSNEQKIYRFGFKIGGSGGTAVSVKEFTVDSASSSIVRKRDYSSNKHTFGSLTVKVSGDATTDLLYMAINNVDLGSDQTYSFHVIDGGNALYIGSQSIPFQTNSDLQNASFISAKNVSVSQATLTSASATTSEVW